VAEIEIANRSSIPALATEALFSLPRWTYESPWIVCQKNACVLPGSGVTPEYILAGIDLPAASGARGSLNGSVLPLFEHKSMLATPPTKPQSRFSWFMAHDPGESTIGELMVVNLSPLREKAVELQVLYQDRHQQRVLKRLAWRGMFLWSPENNGESVVSERVPRATTEIRIDDLTCFC
jgi:hypothetical protein